MKFKNLGEDPPIFLQPEKLKETEIIFILRQHKQPAGFPLERNFLRRKMKKTIKAIGKWRGFIIENFKTEQKVDSMKFPNEVKGSPICLHLEELEYTKNSTFLLIFLTTESYTETWQYFSNLLSHKSKRHPDF